MLYADVGTVIYLDVPDLAAIARTCRTFRAVALDRALHRVRIRVVAPSRVSHALEPAFRPDVAQLCQRDILRGLGVERRWRAGHYIYSPQVQCISGFHDVKHSADA